MQKSNFYNKFGLLVLLLCLFYSNLIAQQKLACGIVYDDITDESLPSANILNSKKNGVITDIFGNFCIAVNIHDTLEISFMGYRTIVVPVNVENSDSIYLSIRLKPKLKQLNETVISESRFEQSLSEVTVSMDIIQPDEIELKNENDLEEVLNKISGVEIIDGQPSIRGGSGYSYGAGSRVLLLLNDLPLLSADAGDAKWNFLPLENIAQIEVVKGASSVLYGSSALNGVINFRTAYAKSTPITKFNILSGIYLHPYRNELKWTNKKQYFNEFNLLHSQKIGHSELVISSNYYTNTGYRQNEFEKRNRFNINYLHHSAKIKNLNYGLNSSFMSLDKIDFFLWQGADSGAYKQNPDAISKLEGIRFNIDPFINYVSKSGIRHNLKSRVFYVSNGFEKDSSKNSNSFNIYNEYQFFNTWWKNMKWIGGVSNKYSHINSNLYGNHTGNEYAYYTQLENNSISRLKILGGFRFEQFYIDEKKVAKKPVFRTGINYQAFELTHIRISVGQGYRYPSIAEKYTTTSVGALNIFPNPGLKAETGLSSEFGILQKLLFQNWLMQLDATVFYTTYKDMIEFVFGIYKPDSVAITTLDYVGFKSQNIGNAVIKGIEINYEVTNFDQPLHYGFKMGYVYKYPKNRDYSAISDSLKKGEILKYRNLHIFKADAQISYKIFSLGCFFSFHSKMANIDSIFLDPFVGEMILPGFSNYWNEKNKAYSTIDLSFAIQLSDKTKLIFVLKNALNKEYIIRPGDISAPRNIGLKLSSRF